MADVGSKQGVFGTQFITLVTTCVCALILSGGAARCQQLADDLSIVHTTGGDVHGQVFQDWRSFQAIPYAAPPKGDLRWRAPQPPVRWQGIRDATQPPPACMQASLPNSSNRMDEDCLYLNVTAPLDARLGSKKPVIVWIHGGGGNMGAGSDYDPHRMVELGDVIVVTINYRLGIFGYFGYPGLVNSGTFGMQDQIAALRWVRANAGAFGGDPHNVTVAGESEGGIAICGLLTSPAARGTFDKAIMESGSCHTLNYDVDPYDRNAFGHTLHSFASVSQVQADGVQFASDQTKGVRCDGKPAADMLNCLQHADANDLNSAIGDELLKKGIGLSKPAYNTGTLPEDPPHALKEGHFYHVPVLSGINRNEDRSVVMLNEYLAGMWFIGPDDYRRLLNETFKDRASDVASRYPLTRYSSAAMAWSALETDRTFVCPQLATEQAIESHERRRAMLTDYPRVPVYAYEFADESSPSSIPFDPDLLNSIQPGAAHQDEVLYILDMVGLPKPWIGPQLKYPWFTPDQEDLSKTMIHYWTQFARTGNPNADGLPNWPRAESLDQPGSVLRLDIASHSGIGLVDAYSDHQCKFWATIP